MSFGDGRGCERCLRSLVQEPGRSFPVQSVPLAAHGALPKSVSRREGTHGPAQPEVTCFGDPGKRQHQPRRGVVDAH